MSSEIATTLGRIRGRREGGLQVFRGVPFAAPPVGERRFRPPAPCPPWRDTRPALDFGPAPLQWPDEISLRLGLFADHPMDEDCLSLNVWTPGCDDARRPLLVWLHGGAFATGTGASPVYDGARLAARGDVVVVTLNYRVGALGFLDLGGDSVNLGLLDQLAALRFLRDNAAAFGGDPERITVFGESAGAGSICALLAMPAARGLFHRAIVQSAAPDGVIDRDEARRRGAIFAGKLGREPVPEALRELPAESLLEAQQRCLDEGPWAKGMFFLPVVDGQGLPRSPLAAVARGEAASVELVIGTTLDEMKLFGMGTPGASMPLELAEKIATAQVPGDAPSGRPRAELLLEGYRKLLPELGYELSGSELFAAFQSDLSLRYPALRMAEAQAAHQPRTFHYLFTWPSPFEGGRLGACHALDLPFTFGTLDTGEMPAFAGNDPAARRFSQRLMDAWCAFARGGDPSHEGIGSWAPVAAGGGVFELGARCGALPGDDPRLAFRALWDATGLFDDICPAGGR